MLHLSLVIQVKDYLKMNKFYWEIALQILVENAKLF